MTIREILTSKNHNIHYLERYLKFILSRNTKIGAKHHICPKAKDMFPEYKSFKENPWNISILTEREHYIAHLLLSKAYPNSSQIRAFYMMSTIKKIKINSRLYQFAKEQHKIFMSVNNPMLKEESRMKCSQKGALNGMFGKSGPNLGKTGKLSHLFGKKKPIHSQRMSGANNPNYGKILTAIECPHCNKIVDMRNYGRWHGDKCRSMYSS